jgi:hypothetical protein
LPTWRRGDRVVALGEQSHVVADRQQALELPACLVVPAHHGERVRQPERAQQERAFSGRQAVHLGIGGIPGHEAVAGQFPADRLDRSAHGGSVAGRNPSIAIMSRLALSPVRAGSLEYKPYRVGRHRSCTPQPEEEVPMKNTRVGPTVVAAVATLLMAACADQPEPQARADASPSPAGATQQPITPGAVAAAPALYYGKVVTVKGEVERMVNNNLFTLDEDRLGAGPDVLVVVPQKGAAPVADDWDVVVSGTLKPFVWAELKRDYDWFDADASLVAEFESRPVIVADSVRRAEN